MESLYDEFHIIFDARHDAHAISKATAQIDKIGGGALVIIKLKRR